MTPYAPGRSPETTITGLIDETWRRYETQPGAFSAAERDMAAALVVRLSP
jgi:hypothetical protein